MIWLVEGRGIGSFEDWMGACWVMVVDDRGKKSWEVMDRMSIETLKHGRSMVLESVHVQGKGGAKRSRIGDEQAVSDDEVRPVETEDMTSGYTLHCIRHTAA